MFQLLVFQPLYNILALFVNLFKGELGWAVLFLAALIRFAIWPWYKKAMGDQRKMTKLQPKIKELQKKHKQDSMKANQEVMKILQAEKINLGGSFLFLFFQIGIFIILFIFFNQAISSDWSPFLYSFVKLPAEINYVFLGLVDLKAPSLILAIISASLNSALTFIQPSTGQNKAMMLGLPFIILLFYQRFPALIILYWIGFSLVNISQEFFLNIKRKLEAIPVDNSEKLKITKKMKVAEIKNFLENLLTIIGFSNFETNIQENPQDKLIQFSLKTNSNVDYSGLLIGRDGENLQALEYLLNILLRKNVEDPAWRIILDINNYRAIQEEKLREFARKIAHQVAITNQIVELPPMRARDRRIVHLEIALRSDVMTESIGENKERHIIIKPGEN